MSDSAPKTEDNLHKIFTNFVVPAIVSGYQDGLDEPYERFKQAIEAREERIRLATEIQFVQGLIDAKDQESDPDGRPVGETYHIMCGNDREYLEYVVLPQLQSQLDKLQKGDK
jgi:hypothetical protein